MVNIIINETARNEDNIIDAETLELIKQISNENIELKELITFLTKKVNNLIDEVSILKKSINNIKPLENNNDETVSNKKEAITVKEVIEDLNKVKKQNNKTIPKKDSRRPKSNSPYVPNKSLRHDWKNLELLEDGSIINHASKKDFLLPIGLNELLYFMEIEKGLTFKSAKELMKKYNINVGTFGKIIYNIRDTHNFDNVLLKYKNNLRKAHFKVKDNYICINKLNTNVKVSQAREWISLIANAPKKQSKILEIQEGNPKIDKDIIRFICDSYNNTELIKLSKNKASKFIENNPSKRRNLIANGGIL